MPEDAAGEKRAPAIWKVALAAMMGAFLSQLDATVVNVSLSSLVQELHSSLSAIQWVASGYLLALALVLPLNGWLVDRIGTKALYLWSAAGFALSSALCGLAWSADSLIAFRALQGVAGGLLAPMAQLIMARAAGAQMARVMGFTAMPVVLAPILGPVVAGAILQHASWRWLFLINLPFVALALLMAGLFLPADRGEAQPRRLDLAGLALLSPGLVSLLYGADHINALGGRIAIGAALMLLAAFLWSAHRKGDRALIDLRLFRGKVFSAAIRVNFLVNGASFGGQMLVPIFLIRACGRSPTETGWLLMPLGLGMMLNFALTGSLTRRFGIRYTAAGGALLAFAGTLPFVCFALRGLDTTALAAALFIRGAGLSAISVPSISAAYTSVSRRDLPMATTALNVVQRLGGPIFTTLSAAFLAWQLKPEGAQPLPLDPYAAVFILLSGLHALICLATLRLPVSMEAAAAQAGPAIAAESVLNAET